MSGWASFMVGIFLASVILGLAYWDICCATAVFADSEEGDFDRFGSFQGLNNKARFSTEKRAWIGRAKCHDMQAV
jgi:hypothetical protein